MRFRLALVGFGRAAQGFAKLRLLIFPSDLQEPVSRDTITPSHAELLARLADQPSEL